MLSSRRAISRFLFRTMTTPSDEPSADLTDMRKPYFPRPEFRQVNLLTHLNKDPLKQFDTWFQYVNDRGTLTFEEINAMALSTATKDGRPSSRMVLVKGYGPDGFKFFTNYNSRKGKELAENPFACLMAYWPVVSLSVRIEGKVEKLPDEEAEEYWAKRPAKSRASAYVSHQSSAIPSKEVLEEQLRRVNQEYTEKGAEIPKPKDWGGYILNPDYFEFWQGDNNRLHDRVRFRHLRSGEKADNVTVHEGENDWVYEWLSP